MSVQVTLDKTAISLSVLCAAHCLILPVIVVLAPTSLALALSDESFHQLLVWGILPISVPALAMGCRKHKQYHVFTFGLVGLLILGLTGVLGHDLLGEVGEKVMTAIGGIVVALGHVSNYRLCRKLKCECPSEECAA